MDRRNFLRSGALGLAGSLFGSQLAYSAPGSSLSPVAVTSGLDRRQNLLRALELMKPEILRAARGRRILLKPNMVYFSGTWGNGADVALSSSHVEQLEIVTDWFRHLGHRDMIVAESTPNGATFDGFERMGYTNLARRHPIVFKDLNQEGYRMVDIAGTAGTVRISSLLLDEAYFVVSLGKLKTHNNVVATFSGKNIFMASPVIDMKSFKNSGGRSDKSRMHGDTNQDLHDNLFKLAHEGIRPHLAIIDGFEGMQGEGPVWGDKVESHAAVVSTDWLAADRVCCELTGIEASLASRGLRPELPAYLRYCAQAGMGAFALEDMELRGDELAPLCTPYQLHDEVAGMIGMDPDAPLFRGGQARRNFLDTGLQRGFADTEGRLA
jgi:uncharacterized protein (DUF362 family)